MKTLQEKVLVPIKMDTKLCLLLILSAHLLTGKILYITTSFLISPVVLMLFTFFLIFILVLLLGLCL